MKKLCDQCGADKPSKKYGEWITFIDCHPWGEQKHYVCSDRCRKNFVKCHPMIEYVQKCDFNFVRETWLDKFDDINKQNRDLKKYCEDILQVFRMEIDTMKKKMCEEAEKK